MVSFLRCTGQPQSARSQFPSWRYCHVQRERGEAKQPLVAGIRARPFCRPTNLRLNSRPLFAGGPAQQNGAIADTVFRTPV